MTIVTTLVLQSQNLVFHSFYRSSSCFTLQEIRLNNTGCGVTGGKLLAKTLLECYENSGKKLALKVFVLGRSRQENEGAKALAQIFKLMGSLEEVVMPQNGIYHEGIAALSDAFSNNPNLRILNMNDNTFTEKGAQALASALPNLQKLQILNLVRKQHSLIPLVREVSREVAKLTDQRKKHTAYC